MKITIDTDTLDIDLRESVEDKGKDPSELLNEITTGACVLMAGLAYEKLKDRDDRLRYVEHVRECLLLGFRIVEDLDKYD